MIPRPSPRARERKRLIALLSARLTRRENPRLAMLAVLTGAALGGFLGSVVLLELGVGSMALRYALAALVGYAVFLLGLRIWLSLRGRDNPGDWSDVASPDLAAPGSDIPAAPGFEFGGGGGFSGGGAGGGIDTSAVVDVADTAESTGAGIDLVPDVDEGLVYLVPVLVGVFLIVGLVGIVAIVVGAPALLAEVLLDALIAGAAYRRLRYLPSRHWMAGAVRRTWKPFLALLITLSVFGAVAQMLGPDIRSVGDVFRD
jgi:hypothetical protein